ncbi:MAG: endonuclease NucS [Desulfurococcales archaeon]|nr:endonuclease NucS [Desulfurococcales archaeon]
MESKGYTIEDTNLRIERNGREIGEVDILARDGKGGCWAVEVKSGYADINGVRQAYVNSRITGCKPLLVARSYSNDEVLELAEQLGVELVFLDDMFTVDPIELKVFMEESVETVFTDYISLRNCIREITPKAEFYLRLLASGQRKLNYEYTDKLLEEMPCLRKYMKDRRVSGIIARYIIDMLNCSQVK